MHKFPVHFYVVPVSYLGPISQETAIHASGGFQTCKPRSKQPQIGASERVATGIGFHCN